MQIRRTPTNTAPVIEGPVDQISDTQWVWDTWPLRNRDGSITEINGWQIIFSLTATDDVVPGARHSLASIRYFYSKNGYDWQDGGEVFDLSTPLGHHQWAGSAMYDHNEDQINLFYTAVSAPPENRQRLALGKGGNIVTSPDDVDILGTFDHHIIAEADGELYQTYEQSVDQGVIYGFRDPWYFCHPETGEDYILFEGNTPIKDPSNYENNWENWNGNVGIARASGDDLTEWTLEKPVIEAITVNQQLERPHFTVSEGRYYLFINSHKFTYAPGLTGPDGLYGFYADSLHGDYQPLNDGGLVVANPETAPFQAYSWLALPVPNTPYILVTSFYNFHDLGGIPLNEVASLPDQVERDKFGGTLAPTLLVRVDGTDTTILGDLRSGYFPSSP